MSLTSGAPAPGGHHPQGPRAGTWDQQNMVEADVLLSNSEYKRHCISTASSGPHAREEASPGAEGARPEGEGSQGQEPASAGQPREGAAVDAGPPGSILTPGSRTTTAQLSCTPAHEPPPIPHLPCETMTVCYPSAAKLGSDLLHNSG